jgi:hypothetical protein
MAGWGRHCIAFVQFVDFVVNRIVSARRETESMIERRNGAGRSATALCLQPRFTVASRA